MFITLNEWYYHSSTCGYQTKPVAVNTDEISDVNEVRDPYHNTDGSAVNLKNGRHYNVKEELREVMEMIAKAERREE